MKKLVFLSHPWGRNEGRKHGPNGVSGPIVSRNDKQCVHRYGPDRRDGYAAQASPTGSTGRQARVRSWTHVANSPRFIMVAAITARSS